MAEHLPKLEPQQEKVYVQSTSFTIDAVARLICNILTPEEILKNPDFDAVIIGSGMYGSYCAEKIYRFNPKLRVLVLEAGPLLITEHVQNLSRIGFGIYGLVADQPWSSNIDFSPHAYCVGGKSVFWGGWSPRLTDEDLTQWPAAAHQYLVENYSRLERQIGVVPETDFIQGELYERLFQEIRAAIPQVPNLVSCNPPPLAVQGESPASGLFSFDKYSSLPLLIDAIREDGGANPDDAKRRLFLAPNVRVLRLHAEQGWVSQIDVSDNGERKSIKIKPSCAVVLALGSIESTRLALNSFPRAANPADELMGRNLMAHMRSNLTVRIDRATLGIPALNRLQTAALHVCGGAGGRRFHLQVTASADRDFNSDALLYRMIPDLDLLDQALANQDSDKITFTIRSVGEMVGVKDRPVHSGTSSWIDLSPHDVDQFGVRKAFVFLTATDQDLLLWDEMDRAGLELVAKLSKDNPDNIEYYYGKGGNVTWYREPPPLGRFTPDGVRDGLGTTYHESGTLWMGDDPATSVTDANGKFHHIANAYCIDQARFPTVGSANPVLTGLVLARKTAEAIAKP